MIASLLFTFLCCSFTVTYAGQTCGYCQHMLDPRYCDTVTKCGDHEYCSVQRYIVGSTVRYDMGCKAADICDFQPSPIGRRSYTDGRFIMCEECCNNTALCSSFNGLCGSQGLDNTSGQICYRCDAMRNPGECERITRCTADQRCYVGQMVAALTGDILWESRCSKASECLSANATIFAPVIGRRDSGASTKGLCKACCSKDNLCNRECHLSLSVPTTEIQTSTTTTSTTNRTTTSTTTTTISSTARTTSSATLIPHVVPHITIFLSPGVAYMGTNVTLTCIAEGNPKPQLQWYIMTSAAKTLPNIHKDAGNRLLIIYNFQLENYGTYACRAFNDLGEEDFKYTVLTPPTTAKTTKTTQQTTTTTTFTPTTTKYVSPQIIYISHPGTVSLGADVTLTCLAVGHPLPNIGWSFWSTNGEAPNNAHVGSNPENLVITNFRSENYGRYLCRARNSRGEEDHREVEILSN